jgi:hypothetical protein
VLRQHVVDPLVWYIDGKCRHGNVVRAHVNLPN